MHGSGTGPAQMASVERMPRVAAVRAHPPLITTFKPFPPLLHGRLHICAPMPSHASYPTRVR